MKLISLVIPIYNNVATIDLLIKKINEDVIQQKQEYQFEVLFINDGSKDGSLELLKQHAQKNKFIKVINLSRNFGQQYAILAGWRNACGDVSIDLSADLQDPPSQCLNMLHEWENGNKIVVSYRTENNTRLTRKLTSRLFYKLILPNAPKGGFDFTLLDRKPLDELIAFKDKNRFYQADILSVGFPFKAIPYVKEKRMHGKSQYSPLKRLKLFISVYLNVGYAPIKFFSVVGIIVTFIGIVYGITVLVSYFVHGYPFKGWTPIMLVILLLGGLILTSLGIIGQYIWRIYDEVKGRPNYIIENIYNSENTN